MNDCRNLPLSYDVEAALEGLEAALQCTLTFRGDAIATIDEVIAGHPKFIMAHLFKAAWLTQAMETRVYSAMVASYEAANALAGQANAREQGHLAAVKSWIDGDFYAAVQHWEDVLTHYPRDLMALQLAHLSHVLLGDTAGQRDTVARVFSLWDETVPGFEFVLGFYAFGLEENGAYFRAEETGRQALAMRPDHPYAIHAVAHVLEMQGRQHGGIRFMQERGAHWRTSHFANHLWWHTALFHLDLGQTAAALEIYDQHLCSAEFEGDKYEELDACALLWRLKLLDVDTGTRWARLADKWESAALDTLYAFNDVHAMMAFVADDREAAQQALLHANERYMNDANDANVAMTREIGLPFCLAMREFHQREYGQCVEHLLPVRYRAHRLGGSHAQRDVIGWTLIEAALRAQRFDLAVALTNERCELKPNSAQNWAMAARALAGLKQAGPARRAEARAQSLMASGYS